jgi:hypothetical protein|uniref:Uncharacterized protein n=1 Tax=viral metagenome TaxID=1070528 RepID=A0A6C0CHV0_9ZZZZ
MFINSILALLSSSPSLHLSSVGKHIELSPVENKNMNDYSYKKGYNEAYFNHPDDSREKLEKIYINYEKYKLLKTLESNNLSVYDKIELIKKNYFITEEKTPNLLAGGLLNEWKFDYF